MQEMTNALVLLKLNISELACPETYKSVFLVQQKGWEMCFFIGRLIRFRRKIRTPKPKQQTKLSLKV